MVSTLTDRPSESTVQVRRSEENNNDHGEIIQATDHGNEEENIQFSSLHECPITQEPPTVGVTFLGHPQVFEYSALYRHIATAGRLTALHSVFHPITHQGIPRDEALNHVNYVTPEVQVMINQQRQIRGLSVTDSNPVTDVDRVICENTMRRLQEP